MDAMMISSSSPQEDEFALLALGAPSPYQILLAPLAFEECVRMLRPCTMSTAERSRLAETLMEFLRRMTLLDRRNPVLKSPTHSFRIRWLAELFPGARFVFITRDPVSTYASNVRLWKALFSRYALTGWTDSTVESLIVSAYEALARAVLEETRELSGDQFVAVTYEDLSSDTEAVLDAIYSRLGLAVSSLTREAWRKYIATYKDHSVAQYLVQQQPLQALVRMQVSSQAIRNSLANRDCLVRPTIDPDYPL